MARGRPAGARTRNGGQWTEARFTSFISSNLRRTTLHWAPITTCLRMAHTRYGFYRCAGCEQEVPASIIIDGKRIKNVHVDHVIPVVDPNIGFVNWDFYINRLFCEADNLQALCHKCHLEKSNREKLIAKERNAKLADL